MSLYNNRPNYLYANISMSLLLFLLGLAGLAWVYGRAYLQQSEEQYSVIVELKPESGQDSIKVLQQYLADAPFTRPGTSRFISREEAAEQLRKELGSDFLSAGLMNPLYDVVVFNVRSGYLSAEALSKLRSDLLRFPAVSDVQYEAALIEQIRGNVAKIGWIALLMSLLLIVIVSTLMHHTVKLSMYANRFLIKNMEMVGASLAFIRRPYVWEGIRNGLFSALAAVVLLVLVVIGLQQAFPELASLHQEYLLGLVFAGLLVLSTFITAASTYYTVNRYLTMRMNELY